MKRGQISIEYLIIVGFVVFLVVTITGIGYFYVSQTREEIKFKQLNSFSETIISTSESTYYAGKPSQRTINAYLPIGITGIEIYGKQIAFNVSTSTGFNRIAFSSTVPLNGSLSKNEGVKKIKIVARENDVLISEE